MKRLWTQDETALLASLWSRSDLSAADIAAKLERPRRAVYVKAHRMGLPPKPDPNTIRLTREQKRWLTLNYPHMRTQICADYLGISLRSCVRWARRLGVEKTPEFMKQCQAVTARIAKESQLRNGTYPAKGYYSPNLRKGEPFQFKPKILNHQP